MAQNGKLPTTEAQQMARNGTTEPAAGRANAGEAAGPPRKRHKPLNSLEAVRKEMVRNYWALRDKELDIDEGKARIFFLGKLVEVFKAKQTDNQELAELLKQARERLN
jgi:hypothetical protein